MMIPMDLTHLNALAENERRAQDGTARSIRKRAGLTLADVGARLGVDETAVGRWENGRRQPRGEVALRWAALLNELDRNSQQQPAA